MYGKRVLDRFEFGRGERMDPLPPPRRRVVDGFDDQTNLLGPGVYILELDGEIIYVAWAKAVLERIAKHRELAAADLPSWFPVKGIIFDRFHFRRCASDIGLAIVSDLIAQHHPRLNEPTHEPATQP